jgi:4-amino-4-deoxy-L-arabinose transferase-like glycosyltransferase
MDENAKLTDASRQQTDSATDNHKLPLLNFFHVQGKGWRSLIGAGTIILGFLLYIFNISINPPGFYVDESGIAYNAYLVAQTGAGEFGERFPLYFQFYTGGFTQYANPTSVYLLAFVFWIFGPSILAARLLAVVSVYTASLLLGVLAARVSGKQAIGCIVALTALVTPWLFEVGRIMLETFFYPMARVLFLSAVYRAQKKSQWTWSDCVLVALTLALLTYTYTIGRLLAPLLALGLLCFATSRQRLFAIVKTWVIYGLTLLPLIVFIQQNPALTTRFQLLSYIKPESTTGEIITKFISRYLEDINPITLLFYGDINQRHHLPDALGSVFFATFTLAVIGIIAVFVRHRSEAWWWFVLYGLVASVVPGALTVDKFHTLRMIAYPVFLLLLTVPALKWLLDQPERAQLNNDETRGELAKAQTLSSGQFFWKLRRGILALLLIATIAEASYFHWQYQHEGHKRGYIFDAAYKEVYDAAVAQPNRPIYLVDGYWGPAYIHSFWYATLEKRNVAAEFIHQPYGVPPPVGVIVISTEQNCVNCTLIKQSGDYILYRTKW